MNSELEQVNARIEFCDRRLRDARNDRRRILRRLEILRCEQKRIELAERADLVGEIAFEELGEEQREILARQVESQIDSGMKFQAIDDAELGTRGGVPMDLAEGRELRNLESAIRTKQNELNQLHADREKLCRRIQSRELAKLDVIAQRQAEDESEPGIDYME